MVIWSDPAKADLRAIHNFISHDLNYYAKKVTQEIVTRTDFLDELPRMGRIVPEFGNEAIRELSLYSYRILYEIKEQNIFVLAEIHNRRNLQPEMIERWSRIHGLKEDTPRLRKSPSEVSYGEQF